MILLKPSNTDRLFYNGRANSLVGSIKAYYLNSILFHAMEKNLETYSERINKFLDYIQGVFPNRKAMRALCEKERRIYSNPRSALIEYGFHFIDDCLSYYVKLEPETMTFNILVYKEEINGKAKTN